MDNETNENVQESQILLQEGPNKKKMKIISMKEFRKHIKHENISAVLQQFHELCFHQKRGQNYVLEYLQEGGSCLELLQLMETHTDVCHWILEIVYFILLEINSKYRQYISNAHDACKYFLNTYMTMTNKMLSLNSSQVERIAILKLLTAIVTLSPNFAKDVLIYVNINSTNLGFLTNTVHSKEGLRYVFINFLIAFLIDGYYPTISALLEKRGLLTSIMKGLVFDDAETVCVVINNIKIHILENSLISKTVKMRTFSTPVVKDIVQLYNWKGPVYTNKMKNKKTDMVQVAEVDHYLKSKVSSYVHDFLLILCTSHKYGVAFKDPQVGLGRKTQNNLIYSVLESLDSPWKHSYASELVVKICGACPDLTKTVWSNLKPSLEPRHTEQWISALSFAGKLFKELDPSRIEYCVKNLTPYQLAQVTQMLVVPTQILKTLTPPDTFDDKYLKYNILKVLMECLISVERYLNCVKELMDAEYFMSYSNIIKDHIEKNFPNSTMLLINYKAKDDKINNFDYLSIVFQLLSMYQKICPQLLDFRDPLINFRKILEYTKKVSKTDSGVLEMKITRLYLDQDPAAFLPNTHLFVQVIPHILDCYCKSRNNEAYEVLERMFLNTGIFESSESEVRVWISSLTNIDDNHNSVYNLLVGILKMAFEKSIHYFSELSQIKNNLPEYKEDLDIKEIIEQLYYDDNSKTLKKVLVKHICLSPLILALFEYLLNTEESKRLRPYLQYLFLNLLHMQTNPSLFFIILQKHDCNFLSKNVLTYIESWNDISSNKILSSSKGKLDLLSKFSIAMMANDIVTFLNDQNLTFMHDILNLLDMYLFYITNLAKEGNLTDKLLENSLEFIKFCMNKEIDVEILKHPILLHYFSPLHVEKQNRTPILITNFILDVIKETKENNDILEPYREKLFDSLKKMFQKPSKYKNFKINNFMNIIKILNLNINQCFYLLERANQLCDEDMLNMENSISIFVHILAFLLKSLNNMDKNYEKVLHKNVIESITDNFTFLISKKENLDISFYVQTFMNYLEIFPHCLEFVNKQLFVSIIQKEEYDKQYADLSVFLLKHKFNELVDDVMENIDKITLKKGMILPFLEILQACELDEEKSLIVFNKVEPLIIKSLQKPQKAGQHFEKHYKGVSLFMEKFLSVEKCKTFVEKVHKFETTEIFHSHLLKTIFVKVINEDRKYTNNAILIYIHLIVHIFKNKIKEDENWNKLNVIIDIVKEFLQLDNNDDASYTQVLQNETYKTFWKFCLKFGLSGYPNLIDVLSILVKKIRFNSEDSEMFLQMIVSHSEFLDVVLNEDSCCKTETLNLMYELFKSSEELMSKQYLPILLAAYRATLKKSDRIIFAILKMFEGSPTQTCFYDFKPFLWGKSAANHYSVRSDIQKALWRQPRIGSVFDILEERWVLHTVSKYPLNITLKDTDFVLRGIEDLDNIYDLTFLLPLFALLLSPENAVQTYRFTKSGSLGLTIAALSSEDKDTRSAACFVLARFYHHVEARQSGKDNQLWLRFIEAICKGMALINDLKLNKFASVFLARMSLILTQPMHIMYVPLCHYLSAKSTLDFSSIPELYTLLHSADVNFKDHRNFILEVIRDSLVSVNDFHVALRSVVFKLIMEQYSSTVSDFDMKRLILQIIKKATALSEGTKFLCLNYGLLSWLYQVVINLDKCQCNYLPIILNILHNIVSYCGKIDLYIINLLLDRLIDNNIYYNLTGDNLLIFFKVLCITFKLSSKWFTESKLKLIIALVNNKEASYLLRHGGKYIDFDTNNLIINSNDLDYYIKFLTLLWLRKNS